MQMVQLGNDMYLDKHSSEQMYSIAEAAALLIIPIEEVRKLIKSKELGNKWTENGYAISNSHIAMYLVDCSFRTREKNREAIRKNRRQARRNGRT